MELLPWEALMSDLNPQDYCSSRFQNWISHGNQQPSSLLQNLGTQMMVKKILSYSQNASALFFISLVFWVIFV